jgi:DNA-binding response OmpR family regulator
MRKMKVIVFAGEAIGQSVADSLAKEGIRVASASDGIAAVNMLRREHFDVALVDSLAEEVGVACCCIGKLFKIPVILLVGESDVDWKRLQMLQPHGYIYEGTGGPEMAARLWAVMRRQVEQVGNYQVRGCQA